jgi:hypothetical protein
MKRLCVAIDTNVSCALLRYEGSVKRRTKGMLLYRAPINCVVRNLFSDDYDLRASNNTSQWPAGSGSGRL